MQTVPRAAVEPRLFSWPTQRGPRAGRSLAVPAGGAIQWDRLYALCGLRAALAHVNTNAIEAAYRRTDLLERRRVLMEHWSVLLAEREDEGDRIFERDGVEERNAGGAVNPE